MGQCFLVRRGGGLSAGDSKPPKTWQFLQAFTANGTFTVPADGWYQAECFGKSGNGGNGGGGAHRNSGTYNPGGGGAGGNAGGYACSYLKLKSGESYPVSVNASLSSFGSEMSATSGGNGGVGVSGSQYSSKPGTGGVPSTVIGAGVGGNQYNQDGGVGGKGGTGGSSYTSSSENGSQGENQGAPGGSGNKGSSYIVGQVTEYCVAGGGGGGGARLSGSSAFTVPESIPQTYQGGNGTRGNGGSAAAYPSILATGVPILYGGGSGGGGGAAAYNMVNGQDWNPGNGSVGTPGCVIISKGAK